MKYLQSCDKIYAPKKIRKQTKQTCPCTDAIWVKVMSITPYCFAVPSIINYFFKSGRWKGEISQFLWLIKWVPFNNSSPINGQQMICGHGDAIPSLSMTELSDLCMLLYESLSPDVNAVNLYISMQFPKSCNKTHLEVQL